ncbi:Uma2 family endonuclease [Singulisphaera rosea]
MTTLITPTRTIRSGVILRQVGWEGYEALLNIVANRPVRLTYDRGDLELMAPPPIHELYRTLIGEIIALVCNELDIPRIGQGSTTFRRKDVDRGLEPDQCYYFENAARIRDRSQIHLDNDPPPDLAIEIDITSSSLDRLGIYEALGIPEVWRFDGVAFIVLRLGVDRHYEPVEASVVLPLLPMKDVARLIHEYDSNNDTRWSRKVVTWIRDEVIPRSEGEPI